MNNTREIKEYYETQFIHEIKAVLNALEESGFSDDFYTKLSLFNDFTTNMDSARTFYKSWFNESELH